MIRISLALTLAAALTCATGAAKGNDNVERLVALGKLWATIKYFHPGLDEAHPEWWDQALLTAVPAVEAASSQSAYRAAINDMLALLRDPVTRVDVPGPLSPAVAFGFVEAQLRDGVLVLTSGKTAGDPLVSLQPAVKLLPQARSVIFDLRSGPVHPWLWGPPLFPDSPGPVSFPAHRFRVHAGNVTPTGAQDTLFLSGSVTRAAPSAPVGKTGVHRRVVFLVNDSIQLPLVAAALQVAGAGYIVSERPIDDRAIARHGMATHYRMPLGEGLVGHIRTSLMVHADGSTGLQADRVSANDAMSLAFASANGAGSHAPRPPAPAVYGVRAVEEPYADSAYPSRPLRVLAAMRIWAAFEWLNPYRDLMDGDWDQVLKNSLTELLDAPDARSYHLAVAEMVAHVRDTHAVVLSPTLDEFFGTAAPAITLRPVQGKPVVVRIDDPAASAGVAVGDVVLTVDGSPVADRLALLSRYISASTPQAHERDTVNALLRGADADSAELTVQSANGVERVVSLPRKAAYLGNVWRVEGTEPFRVLPSGFGYMDLRLLMPHQVDTAFDAFETTKGLIFDMRGYPNGTALALATRLCDKAEVPVPVMWLPLLFEPGAQTRHTFSPPLGLGCRLVPYRGKTVMLIDDRAQSQSEHTAIILRAVHGTTFIGSATAGANGEGSNFRVPGGIFIGMTGVGVRHPDGSQLQRVGVIPDIAVQPTIDGIRSGRDEILERAVRYLEEVTVKN